VFAYPKFPGTQVQVHIYEIDVEGGDRAAHTTAGLPMDVAEQIGRWRTELDHRDSGTSMNAFAAAAAEAEREGTER
jgi:hypothetical protein